MTKGKGNEALAKALAPVIKRYTEESMRRTLGPVFQRLEILEAKIAELESRPELKHCGIWKPDKVYKANALVTMNGGLWLALKGNKQRPVSSSAWQLIVKSGSAQ